MDIGGTSSLILDVKLDRLEGCCPCHNFTPCKILMTDSEKSATKYNEKLIWL